MLACHVYASACVCDLPLKRVSLKKAIAEAKSEAAAVFSGQVTELNELAIKFKVEQMWKGAPTAEIVMQTGVEKLDGGNLFIPDCAYDFKLGERYLVYAYDSKGKLQAHKCTRTTLLEGAGEDIRVLKNFRLKKAKAAPFIRGKA